MRTFLTAATLVAVGAFGTPAVVAQSKKIDLQTKAGVAAVKGSGDTTTSRSSRSKERDPTAGPTRRTTSSPAAAALISTTASGKWSRRRVWRTLAPTVRSASAGTGSRSRSPPRPPASECSSRRPSTTTARSGSTASCPRTPGKGGEAVVAGFNAPNRVELNDPQPGKVYQIAVFAINGPISAAPSNWLFLKNTALDIEDKPGEET